jgi:digeranylgeranylglycerophospholipid reductase
MAARVAAEQGAKVMLLEEHEQAGLPNHCAEALEIEAFKDAGLQPTSEIVSQEINATRVYVPSGKFVDLRRPDWVGYTINRDVFDRVLSERATDAGAELMNKTRACAITKEGAKVSGVIAKREGEMFRIGAKVVIGADGIASVVRNGAGLGRSYPDVAVCAQFRLGALTLNEPDVDEIHLGLEVAPGGYAWVFPKSRETANVGLGVRRTSKESAAFYLKRLISDSRFKGAKILETTGGITPTSGVLERIVENGVMLVGDAAGQIIPFSGAGVHTGIVAGRMAGADNTIFWGWSPHGDRGWENGWEGRCQGRRGGRCKCP